MTEYGRKAPKRAKDNFNDIVILYIKQQVDALRSDLCSDLLGFLA